jgi:ABC-type sugar transport system ATPase subunit
MGRQVDVETTQPESDRQALGIEIRGLRKTYGDTRALDSLDLAGKPGEVLGIAGPNGAGKSTLIGILAGEITPDEGEIRIDGEVWSPQLAAQTVAVVHQEPQLFPNLTIGENLLVGREGTNVRRPSLSADERRMLADLEIDRFVNDRLERCTLAVRQRAEIARALIRNSRCFLFDEPNSALTDEESAELFNQMRRLSAVGHIVMLVSHRLAELVAISDRVAVLRDGRCAEILEGEALTQEAVASEMVVGRAERTPDETAQTPRASRETRTDHLLTLQGWTHAKNEFQDVDMHVEAGEIVALIGVEGSGARELLRSIAGFEPASGTIEMSGLRGDRAIRKVGYVAPDRRESLFANLSVGQNIVVRLGAPRMASVSGLLRKRKSVELAQRSVERFAIRCRSVDQPLTDLSGGNQQKVAIAATTIQEPQVLALEEPTRGVDIGSKSEIYELLRQYAGEGHAVVLYCTEVSEVFESADRAHVVSEGRISSPLEVRGYADMETLARDITRLERQGLLVAASA